MLSLKTQPALTSNRLIIEPHWRATSPFSGIRWTRGSRRMSKSSFILEIRTLGSTLSTVRGTCAWRLTAWHWGKLAGPCSSSRLDCRPVTTFRSWTCAWICSSPPSMSRAARIREWRATGRLGWATSSSRTSCGVIRRQFPSARRLKTSSVSTTSTSTCTSMGCCKINQSRRSLNALMTFDTNPDSQTRPLRVGIGGPVGSGKTALCEALCKRLRDDYDIYVITNDIYTKEDQLILTRAQALPAQRIMGVETGGCPHTAIREDASMNLAAIEDMNQKFPHAELCFIESGGDNLAATFSPELADLTIYVIDVAAGEKIPRKGGPGITRSD